MTKEAKQAPDVLRCTFLVNLTHARILFDSGASRSLVSETFCRNFTIPIGKLEFPVDIKNADGKILCVSKVYRDCKLEISDETFLINLIPMFMGEFDVVLAWIG